MDKLVKLSQTLYTEAFATEYDNYAMQFGHAIVWFMFSVCVVGCLYFCGNLLAQAQLYLLKNHVLPELYKVKDLAGAKDSNDETDSEYDKVIRRAIVKTVAIGGSSFLVLVSIISFVCSLDATLSISVGVTCSIIVAVKLLSRIKLPHKC